jgi:hypothetical protein
VSGDASSTKPRAGDGPEALVCRLCGAPLPEPVFDLGAMPLANAYVTAAQLGQAESYYPLRLLLCPSCGLVQLEAVATSERIFGDYAYFSSYSSTLLTHAERFAGEASQRFSLGAGSLVAEVASNDGYQLRYFKERGCDVLGIEPARNIARVAGEERGIPTIPRFFGRSVARELVDGGRRPRLLIANNVVAHVPDLNDFLAGLALLLPEDGVLSLEFHHLLPLVVEGQFDIIYHEHFQYYSLGSITTALSRHGLAVFDVHELPTQGGSLRVFARHARGAAHVPSQATASVLEREHAAKLAEPETYRALAGLAMAQKLAFLSFLIEAKRAGKSVVCFGAAAKGNTFLNYCGVRGDLVDYAVDSSPHKQGLYLPGSRLSIRAPAAVHETKPDYVVILPWNLRHEISAQMADIRNWGGRFVVASPALETF